MHFNPRSPHGERHLSQKFDSLPVLFQSTLPAWGATERAARGGSRYTISIHAPRMGSDTARIRLTGGSSYFNPRSPHGERQNEPQFIIDSYIISIHAPRMGSDLANRQQKKQFQIFQSTLPAWGATVQPKHTAMTA